MLTNVFVAVLIAAQAAPLPKLVGTLSVTSGKVRLVRAGSEPRLAGKFVRVRVGDKLVAATNPVAFLTLDAVRETYRLRGKGSLLVQERSLKVLDGTSPVLVSRASPLLAAPGGPPITLAPFIRGDGFAVSPTGAVLGAPIRLTWTRGSGTTELTVDLMDAGGNKVWHRDNILTNEVALPADKSTMGRWMQARVTQVGGGKVTSCSTWVLLMPLAEQQELAGAEKKLRAHLAGSPQALGLALGDLWASAELVSSLPKALDMVFPEHSAQESERARHWKYGEWLEAAGFANDARDAYQSAWLAGERAPELKDAIERLGGKAELSDLEKAIAQRDRLMKQQRYKEALPWSQKVVAILRKQKPGSLVLARGLDGLAKNLQFLSDLQGARRPFESALAIRQRLVPGSLEVAMNLCNLGGVAYNRDELDLAQRRFEAALAIHQRLSTGSLVEADILNNLGTVSYRRGDLDLAQRRFQAALAIRQRLDPKSLAVAQSLNNIGTVAQIRGQFAFAQRQLEAALAISNRRTPGSLNVAENLNNLGTLAERQGNLDLAQRPYEAALAIYEKREPGSKDEAGCLNNLGSVAEGRGDLELAERSYLAAHSIFDRLEPGSLDLATCLDSLGECAHDRGDLDLAESWYEAAFVIRRRLAPDSKEVAYTLNNLGLLAQDRGDLDLAQRDYEVALATLNRSAPGSMDVATCLTNLGNVALSRGDLDLAERRHRAALKISKRWLSPGSLSEAYCLTNLGTVSWSRGDLELAQRRFEAALSISKALVPGSFEVAANFNNLGDVEQARGNLALAQRRYESALAILERLAPGSLSVAESLTGIRKVAASRGDQVALATNASERLELTATLLASQGLSRAGELGSIGNMASESLRSIGLLEDPHSFYPWLPTLRGAGLTLQARAKAAERSADADEGVRNAVSEVQIATKKETEWASNPRPKSMSEKTWEGHLIDLRANRRSAELKLATLLKERDPRLGADLKVSPGAVQNAMPAGAALVEFLKLETWDKKARKPGPDAYGAFVARRKGEVQFVRLGEAKPIDDLVQAWQTQVAIANDPNGTEGALHGTEVELDKIGRELYGKVISPLGELPPNLMIAPDSDLNALPFEALVDPQGRFLVETTQLSVVGSGRDLVEKPPAGEPGPGVVIAAPDFGAEAEAVAKSNGPVKSELIAMRAPNAKGTWDPLPSAEQEGQAVARALGVEPITGIQATKTRLYGLVRPRVLHIATHGFFFPPIQARKERETVMASEMSGRALRAADSPMLRSGLILAGANTADKPDPNRLDDGWATALEISQMDLRGTELVVLSACDTARGDVRGAEGVFGLQRAFRFAGAHTLVMSTFKVPDEATRSLMERFYGAWKPGDPAGSKLSALRDAQLAMIRDPKTRHPRNWAGFVLMGER